MAIGAGTGLGPDDSPEPDVNDPGGPVVQGGRAERDGRDEMVDLMSGERNDVLARAAGALRSADVPGWIEVAGRAKAMAASVARQSWPVRGRGASGDFVVGHRVLRSLVRRELRRLPELDVDGVDFELDGQRLVSATVGIVVRYGVIITEVAEDVRARTAGALAAALGVMAPAAEMVDVQAVDLTLGDPREG